MAETSYVSPEQWRELPLPLRLAVGATLIERVLPLRSAKFRRHFHQDEALAHAWAVAEGREVAAEQRSNLYEAIGALLGENGETDWFEDEDGQRRFFSFEEAWLAAYLLEEIDQLNGNAIAGAVGAAAITLATVTLRQHNIEFLQLYDELETPIYDAAYEMYSRAKSMPDEPIRRDMFSAIKVRSPDLDGALRPLGISLAHHRIILSPLRRD